MELSIDVINSDIDQVKFSHALACRRSRTFPMPGIAQDAGRSRGVTPAATAAHAIMGLQ